MSPDELIKAQNNLRASFITMCHKRFIDPPPEIVFGNSLRAQPTKNKILYDNNLLSVLLPKEQLAMLAHETAHVIIHRIRKNISTAQMEEEADKLSCVLIGERQPVISALDKMMQHEATLSRAPHMTMHESRRLMDEQARLDQHGTFEERRERIMEGDLSEVRKLFLQSVKEHRAAHRSIFQGIKREARWWRDEAHYQWRRIHRDQSPGTFER